MNLNLKKAKKMLSPESQIVTILLWIKNQKIWHMCLYKVKLHRRNAKLMKDRQKKGKM